MVTAQNHNNMANLVTVKAGEQQKQLDAMSAKGARTLAGGLNLPEGIFPFTVAKEKAFGILEVQSADKTDWALPIVAGTMTVNGKKIEFVRSAEPGAKTLVIPDTYYTGMEIGKSYNVTIGSRRNRKVVLAVEPLEAGAETPSTDED